MEPSRQQVVSSDQNGWGLRLCAERFVQRTLLDRRFVNHYLKWLICMRS